MRVSFLGPGHPPTVDRVVVAGDWHGNLPWIERALVAAGRTGATTILHLGDFGIWPGRTGSLLEQIDRWCASTTSGGYPGIQNIAVVPGNHDDWGMLTRLFSEHPGEAVRLSKYVHVLPRGYRFTIGSRTCLAFGGAPSIDFLHRAEGISWWRDELPSLADVAAAVDGGHADVLLTHDVGEMLTPKVAAIINSAVGWSEAELEYANTGRPLIQQVIDATTPLAHLHGHLHVRDSATFAREGLPPLRVESLDCDGRPGNIVVLDLATLRVTGLVV